MRFSEVQRFQHPKVVKGGMNVEEGGQEEYGSECNNQLRMLRHENRGHHKVEFDIHWGSEE
jgi:hypothetical protein